MKVIKKLITIATVMILTSMQCHAAPGDEALLEACINRNWEAVKNLLIAAGAAKSVNKPDGDGRTPLHHACMPGNAEVVNLLFMAHLENELTKYPSDQKQSPYKNYSNSGNSARITRLFLPPRSPNLMALWNVEMAQLSTNFTISTNENYGISC